MNYKIKYRKLKIIDTMSGSDLIYSCQNIPDKYNLIKKYYPKYNILDVIPNKNKNKNKHKKITCAVVFNSAELLDQNHGSKIDSHDLVIRVNFAMTSSFKSSVGERTDVRILGRDWIYWEKNEIIIHTYNSKDYYYSDIENILSSKSLRNKGIYIWNDDNIDNVVNKALNSQMTNGLRAVLLGLTLSEHVYIYGKGNSLGKVFKENSTMSHYPSEIEQVKVEAFSDFIQLSKSTHDKYFGSIKGNKNNTIHSGINLEYLFYKDHKRVTLV
jgi:hypothetical protein